MIEIFSSITAKYIFYTVIILWLISEIIGGRLIPSLRRHGSQIKEKDDVTQLLLIVGIIISIIIVIIFTRTGFANIAALPSWVFTLGIIFMILGIIIRQWSIAVLGRFFSPKIGVQKDQKVVDNGPYKLIRHPSYTGHLLILTGIGLAYQSSIAVIIILLVFGVVIGYRIHVEEKMLITALGNNYVEYMKRTKKLIPYVRDFLFTSFFF